MQPSPSLPDHTYPPYYQKKDHGRQRGHHGPLADRAPLRGGAQEDAGGVAGHGAGADVAPSGCDADPEQALAYSEPADLV